METNRGCPFKCNYCYWGAAIGAKVHKYGEDRVLQELTRISEAGYLYLFFADANFGMQQRDIEVSRHVAACKTKTGTPLTVYFSGAKNSPERVAEITKIFSDAEMVATQSIALQTMSPATLRKINRENIKTNSYIRLQQTLNERNLSSFIELIWPLPGETLESFQSGLAELCTAGADSFVIYPLLLMNNVEMSTLREEYQLVTASDPDPCSEAEIVIGTSEVDRVAYHEGIRTAYAVTAIFSIRGLVMLGRYLRHHGYSYLELLQTFIAFSKEQTQHPYTRFCEDSIQRFEQHRFENVGQLMHIVLHQERAAFDELLLSFVKTQPFWRDDAARFWFEVDLIHRPYIYRTTPIVPKLHRFDILKVRSTLPHGYGRQLPCRKCVAVTATCLTSITGANSCHSWLESPYTITTRIAKTCCTRCAVCSRCGLNC
jgi:putative methyltransferase